MLILLLLALAAVFVLLFVFRVGGTRRAALIARWPAVLLAAAALFALARGAIWPAIALASLAGIVWQLWPRLNRARKNQQPHVGDGGDIEACALLGVRIDASADEIRSAYRAKMASAHPDRGGGHEQAARLTAARDRLLKRRNA